MLFLFFWLQVPFITVLLQLLIRLCFTYRYLLTILIFDISNKLINYQLIVELFTVDIAGSRSFL